MKQAQEKQMEALLEYCVIAYDIYDYDNDIAYLKDDLGGDVISINFDTSLCEIEDTIFIDEVEYSLSDEQKQRIYDFLTEKTKQDQIDKMDRKNESYERPYFYLDEQTRL